MVGAGATGGYFGGRLAQAGRDVMFLVRPGRAAALRRRGLRIVGLGRDETIAPQLVTAGELASPYDLVLLAVKATGLPQAVDDLATAVGPQTTLVPFLNGVAHLDVLNARFGQESVLGGVVKVLTTVNDDGDIVRLAPLASVTIGGQAGGGSPGLDLAEASLSGAGFDLSTSADIVAAMWHKWVFIATVGALTCLMRGTVGDVVAVPGGAEIGPAILAEAASVAVAAGYPLPDDERAAVAATVTQADSAFAPSMYRDVTAGHLTEVEHVFGDLGRRARLLSVATPLIDLATMQLRVHQHRTVGA